MHHDAQESNTDNDDKYENNGDDDNNDNDDEDICSGEGEKRNRRKRKRRTLMDVCQGSGSDNPDAIRLSQDSVHLTCHGNRNGTLWNLDRNSPRDENKEDREEEEEKGHDHLAGRLKEGKEDDKKEVEELSKDWWVFLMVNLAEGANKSTQILVDRSPETAMLLKNSVSNKGQNVWTILMRVGGFESHSAATSFYNEWNRKSRGLNSRIKKCILLVEKYRGGGGETKNKEDGKDDDDDDDDNEGEARSVISDKPPRLWVTSKTKEEMLAFYRKDKLWLESTAVATLEEKEEKKEWNGGGIREDGGVSEWCKCFPTRKDENK